MDAEPNQQTDDKKPAPEGDYAPYGYGHPAHLPDPDAKYAFEPQERRLPVKRERRWRVPG